MNTMTRSMSLTMLTKWSFESPVKVAGGVDVHEEISNPPDEVSEGQEVHEEVQDTLDEVIIGQMIQGEVPNSDTVMKVAKPSNVLTKLP